MKKPFNYLGLLSVLSMIGIVGFFQEESRNLFGFFGFIGYIGYFFITPDELFKQRVLQTAGFTFLITFAFMMSLFIGEIITGNINYYTNGFWISFTLMIVTFPVVFTYFEFKDGASSK
jgi:hypothetical protein